MKIYPLDNPEHELAAEDLIDTINRHFDGMLSLQAAQHLANDVVNSLAEEGWLIDPPKCDHINYDTNAYDCERLVRPGRDRCDEHQ